MQLYESEVRRRSRNAGEHPAERVATGLGWFSIGLGLAEVIAPARLSQLIGVPDGERDHTLMRLYGLREIAAGVGILSQPRPAGWLWARVGGDLLDLASLGAAYASDDADRKRVCAASMAVLGVTALDIACAQQLTHSAAGERMSSDGRIQVMHSVAINRSPEDAYHFWRDFQNLPRFMTHLRSVEVRDERRSHWCVRAPAGMSVEWDAEIVDDKPGELIAWRSLEGADIQNSGHVRFERAPGGRGTLVRVQLEYAPPGGAIAAMMAKLFGEEPEQQLKDDLRLFKQVMETGNIVRSDASIHWGPHPAQPTARREELVSAQ